MDANDYFEELERKDRIVNSQSYNSQTSFGKNNLFDDHRNQSAPVVVIPKYTPEELQEFQQLSDNSSALEKFVLKMKKKYFKKLCKGGEFNPRILCKQ